MLVTEVDRESVQVLDEGEISEYKIADRCLNKSCVLVFYYDEMNFHKCRALKQQQYLYYNSGGPKFKVSLAGLYIIKVLTGLCFL